MRKDAGLLRLSLWQSVALDQSVCVSEPLFLNLKENRGGAVDTPATGPGVVRVKSKRTEKSGL